MATKCSIVKVSTAGYVDSQVAAALSLPDADPAHFVAPGANGTWTKFTDANATAATQEATQASAQVAAGYFPIEIAGTVYRLVAMTAT